ncbi:recombinase family protein [uncultured Kordia sp.]|uniref:recombinase family protein n=1 Tax=uncultured Kordia sp. TaxID=507699 RepID=UPI00261A1BA6|nr:recombinase family protein [uncultured Kordia sp.]
MDNLQQFQSFAKQNKKGVITKNEAVIYTRVSGSKQEDNTSLESQNIQCTQYASRLKLTIKQYFGGTYESAKTDDRKQFKKMITYVKKHRIAFIIVYSIDRFSRAGASAITIVEELKKIGINVLSVTQPVDVETSTGMFFQNLNLLFSKYDNDQRRDKTIMGMRQRLLNGYWMGKAPLGYKNARDANNAPIIVFDENAKYIKKIFLWKLNESLSNKQILDKLSLYGIKLYKQKLTNILRNPVYCGLIAHNLLDGEIIKGKHKGIITKDTFLKVNNINTGTGYKQHKANDNLPLKGGFIKCAKCEKPLTGYIVKKKNIHYYKCGTIGCGCNKNANKMNQLFLNILEKFQLDKKLVAPLKLQLKYTFQYFNKSNKDNAATLKYNLKTIKEKFEKIQERYAIGEIDTVIYNKFSKKFSEEMDKIENEINKTSFEKSNLDFYIDKSINLISNLHNMWNLSDYTQKQQLQNLLFPNGILYDKENDTCRTLKTNSILELTNSLSVILNQKNSGQKNNNVNLSALVAGTGLEPVTFGL